MAVLVTGGAGYLGSILVKKLIHKGYSVRVLDKLIFGNTLSGIKGNFQLIKDDIRDVDIKIMDGVDAVIHLAGFSTDPTSQYDPRLTDLINHLATERLAKMAREKRVKRFIYASSCSVYFTLSTPLDPPLYKETDLVNPISAYSLTKRCSEQVLWGMTSHDFQPTVLRKGTLFGYSPRMRYDLVFNSFAKDAYFKRVLTVDAGGLIWRPMIDIQDATDVYIQCLELPLKKIGGKIFNVSDQNWSIGNLAKKIKEMIKRERKINIELDIKPFGQTRNYKVDTTLFKTTFNFKPSRSLEDALFEIWHHLENNKKHKPHSDINYSDRWYQKFFLSREGRKFRKYV